jgi:hypothetical protein
MTDRPVVARKSQTTIGQIIAALDDRNLSQAMRLLDSASESAHGLPNPDQQDAPRCVRCATRGE